MTDNRSWTVVDTAEGRGASSHLVLWNEFADSTSPHTSLPTLLRESREEYRSAILAALDEVASSMVGGRPLHETMTLEPGLSYLHMTLVWAKRWGELGVISDAVKLLAFVAQARHERPSFVHINVANPAVASAIASSCSRLGIPSDGTSKVRRPRLLGLRAARHLLRWFTLASPRTPISADTYIADYLFRADLSRISDGRYSSGYWDGLPDVIAAHGGDIVWLHRFTPHPQVPKPADARRAVRTLPSHYLIDEVRGPKAALAAWRIYRRIGALECDSRDAFVIGDCDLWPIFEREWTESFRGSHPMSIAINMVNLRHLLPNGRKATLLYIYENQPWEFALRHFSNGEMREIAVPHATIRFWDLRYFVGPKSTRLLPSTVAVNSPIARAELVSGGYSEKALHDVEALMYLSYSTTSTPDPTKARMLVLGELEESSTQRYLDWAVANSNGLLVTFKPHPLTDVRAFTLDGAKVQVSSAPTEQLISESRVVVLGASGSASLEAIARGVPTIAVLNPCELDLSPIGRHPLLTMVATERELDHAVRSALATHGVGLVRPIFHHDEGLGRWRKLLDRGVS